MSDRGVRVNILSNGWTWSEEHVRRAQAAGLGNVAFSLDGLEEAHDKVRREGSYRRVIAAIEASVGAGMVTTLVTHINMLNCTTCAPCAR